MSSNFNVEQINLTEGQKNADYEHYVFYVNELPESKLPLSRLCKIFGPVRYALEAFEGGRHVMFSSDDYDERKQISDYVRTQMIAEGSRVFIIVRNESIRDQRAKKLCLLLDCCEKISFDYDVNNFKEMANHCFVLTVEAFRTLYLNSPEFLDVVGYTFIFEDFEYIANTEVGHWYEEILLSPPVNAQLVFLLPCIQNANEISKWVCSNRHDRPIHCIRRLKRKSPLLQFIARKDGQKLGLVVGKCGTLMKQSFDDATKVSEGMEPRNPAQPQMLQLVRTVLFRQQNPILIYSGDLDDVEKTANILENICLNSDEDQYLIEEIYNSELKQFDKYDANFDDFVKLLPFLKKGIAIYHSDMVPFLRGMVEYMVIHNWIKIIVADEAILKNTNFQFKAAIIMKDRYMTEPGVFRWIKPSEYREICTRVHGTEEEGSPHCAPMVILLNGEMDMPHEVAEKVFIDNVPYLESQMRFTPISSTLLTKGDVIEKSLKKFQKQQKYDLVHYELRQKDTVLREFIVPESEKLEEYASMEEEIKKMKKDLQSQKFIEKTVKPFMATGRIVKIKLNNLDFGYCVVVRRIGNAINVLLRATKESYDLKQEAALRPSVEGLKEVIFAIRLPLSTVYAVTTERLRIPSNLCNQPGLDLVRTHLLMVVANWKDDIPELRVGHLRGYFDSLSLKDALLKKEVEIETKEKALVDLGERIPNFHQNMKEFEKKQKMAKEVDDLEKILEDCHCDMEEDAN